MNLTNMIASKIVYAVAKLLSGLLGGLIYIVDSIFLFIKNITKTLTRGCFSFFSMGGCLFALIFAAPLTIRLLLNPLALFIIIFFVGFLMYGVRFASYLRYIKYITTEYLFNLSNHFMDEQAYEYKAFSEYKDLYKKEQEKQREEEANRYYEQQREQQRRWAEEFSRYWNQQNHQRTQGNYGPYYVNFSGDFKKKYERSCDILGVPYNADEDQIKVAYRKKAKEYHPDLNESPNASKLFQEVKEAYEFLSEENIQRYKNG